MSTLRQSAKTKIPDGAVVLPARTYVMSAEYADKLVHSGVNGKLIKRVMKMGPIHGQKSSK